MNKSFDFSIGLIKPRLATKAIASFMCRIMDVDSEECVVRTSSFSRHSELSTSSVGDVILIRDNGRLDAGQVWIHADMAGCTMAVVQKLSFVRNDDNGTSVWRKLDNYDVIPVEDIIDPVTWNDFDGDLVRIISPADIEFLL